MKDFTECKRSNEMSKKSNKKKNDYIKKIENQAAKAADKKDQIKYEPAPDVTLTAYTFIAMLVIAVSAAATALGAIVSAKPIYYGMDMMYGKDTEVDLVEILSQALFEGGPDKKIKIMIIIAAVATAITALVSLVVMIRAMAPEKKPLPILSWINLVLSIAVAVVFALATKEIYDTGLFNPIQRQFNFNIYVGAAIGYGVNVLFMIANVIGNYMGLKKFKKNGKAY